MLNIWLRTTPRSLSKFRGETGVSIHHDAYIKYMSIHPCIKLYPEYPIGVDSPSEPATPEYKVMWFGDMTDWQIDQKRFNMSYSPTHESILLAEWIETINKCDIAFFGSRSCANFQKDNGIKIPIYVFPGGVDTDYFTYIDRDFDGIFRFLHLGITQWRKASHLACEAFSKSFPYEDDVRLIIRSPGRTDMFNELEKTYYNDKRILFQTWLLPHEKMQLAYNDCHCLLYPSFSEGWGLVLPEALMTGMPVIASRFSSMLDQMDDNCGWWVEMKQYPAFSDTGVNMDSLIEKMRTAYRDRSLCREKSLYSAEYAKNNLTWVKSINGFVSLMSSIGL